MELIGQIVIVIVLGGILIAIKQGFNQVIAGLGAIHEQLSNKTP